jgi:hypothetical protein
VERLLRDLYCDIESDVLDSVLNAIFVIVEEFSQYVRKDLWQEHDDAMNWDGREPDGQSCVSNSAKMVPRSSVLAVVGDTNFKLRFPPRMNRGGFPWLGR